MIRQLRKFPQAILACSFLFVLCFRTTVLTAQEFQVIPDVQYQRFEAATTSFVIDGVTPVNTVEHSKWYMMGSPGWETKFSFRSVDDIIKVGIDPKVKTIIGNYKYRITLAVKGYKADNPTNLVTASPVIFVLEYNKDSLQSYNDVTAVKLANTEFHKMFVSIADITDLNNPSQPSLNVSQVAKNFFIESSIAAQRYDKDHFRFVTGSSFDATKKVLNVGWYHYLGAQNTNCYFGVAYENFMPAKYELEWTYVDDYQYDLSTKTGSYKNPNSQFNVSYNFRNNATRIQTNNLTYAIPMIYEHGAIVFRVRTIRPSETNYNLMVYDDWTLPDAGTLTNASFSTNNFQDVYICPNRCLYMIGAPFEDDKFNWQYAINFAEEGKYKHVLNYFDGAGHSRQTLTKLNSDDSYILGVDQIYDYEGRPAIKTLPTPIFSQDLSYKPDLTLKSGTANSYSASDFDYGCYTHSIPGLGLNSLAGMYYSPDNPHQEGMQKFVPDAEGFPFIETIYSPDYTDKVLFQGGAGQKFQIGNEHVTSNTYVRADQYEINRLFGTQVGRSEYYPKVITKDPNNQLSLSIFNQSGKVIATALAGAAPDASVAPIMPLNSIGTASSSTTNILANLTQSTGDGLRSVNYSFFPEAAGSNSFLYHGSIPPYPTGCSGKFINVQGFYNIKIVNDCGDLKYPLNSGNAGIQYPVGVSSIVTSNASQYFPGTPSGTLSLNPEKYTFIKELYFPDTTLHRMANQLVDSNTGFGMCYDYEDNFVRRSVEAAKFPCKTEEPASPCDQLKAQMKAELYPGAKYGKYNKTLDGKFLSGANNSIFTLINVGGGSTNVYTSDCYYIRTCFVTGYNVEPPPGSGGNGNNLEQGPNPGVPVQYAVTDTVWGPGFNLPPMHPGFYGGIQNSDTFCNSYKYRYQLDCTHLPDVHVSATLGATVVDLNIGSGSNVSPDNLINHFTDAMADSLLPYHPEYCKLLLCDDHLEDILNKITCYQDARALGLTTLQQIFDQDPLHQSSTNPAGLTFAQLSRFAIGNPTSTQPTISTTYLVQRIDSLAREKAWCGCDGLETYAYCRNSEYKYDIKNADIELADTQIQNSYIKNLIAFYIGNRTIRKQRILDATQGDCSPCEDNRMVLIAPPVFIPFFNGNNVSSSFGLPADVQNAFNQGLNGNNPGLPASLGGSTGSMATDNSENIRQQVKVIMTSLQNCGLTYNDSTSLSLYLTGSTISGTNGTAITPAVVKAKLELMGYNINNLCNSFLAKYNIYDTKQNRAPSNFVNKKAEFYTGLQSFLAETGLKTALNNASASGGASSTITLSPTNVFESELAGVLQASTSGTITATCYLKTISDAAALPADNNGSTARTVYAVVLANGSYNDTLFFSKRKNVTQTDCNNNVTYTIPGGTYYADVSIIGAGYLNTFSFSNVRSVLSDPATLALSDGYIADNLVYANLSGIAGPYGQPGCDNFAIWSHKLSMLKPKNADAVDDCINCVQIKDALTDYFADAGAQGMPLFANHPNFKVDLSNYLNTKLKQRHSYYEYERLMKGCALSNFLKFKRSVGQYHLTFSQPADLLAFVNNINTVIGGNVDYYSYKVTGTYHLWVDLNSVPVNKYLTVAQLMPAGTDEGFDDNLIVNVFIPQNSCGGTPPSFPTLPAGAVIGTGIPVRLKNIDNGFDLPYTLYAITGASNMAENGIADAIGNIKSYCESGCPGTVYQESRKVMRSGDYSSVAKTNYLDYIYGLASSGQSQGEIADNIAPSVVKSSVAPFTGSDIVSYNDPWCAGNKEDLYYANAGTSSDPGWARLQGIIGLVSSSSGLGANKLFPSSDITTIAPGSWGSSLKVIKMANGTAWYRLFDNQNKMFNIYIAPAANMQENLSSYTIAGPIEPALGPDSVYTFKVKLQNSSLLTTLVPHVVTCYGYTNFGLLHTEVVQDVVLSNNVSDNCLDTLPCERITALNAIQQGKMLYREYIDSLKDYHYFAMKDFFPVNTVDTLDFTTQKQQYQYTLYNYDLAGNLTSTIPPDGVKPITNATTLNGIDNARNQNNSSSTYWPAHTKKSEYTYNSYNQLISQNTPDAGLTTFYYNKSGQLSFSQNAKQKLSNRFTYTLYDEQGRIDETGVTLFSSATPALIFQNCPNLDAKAIADQIRGMVREDVVATFYDEALLSLGATTGLSAQQNLRKRVSSVLYIKQLALGNSAESYYDYATHYSYDALGNVKTLVQDNPYMDYLGQRFKRIDYDYDLLSGKVNMISYNHGKSDQFYQKYTYDADNRVTKAESSNDGLIWDRDASYTYYKHGSLAQMSIGEYNVQSVQYAYTIQGWLKAINGDVLDSTADMGQDGIAGSAFPSDVIAHALEYYENDYKSISNTPVTYASGGTSLKNLYNGNISRQTTGMNSIGTLQRTYQYDQLNRLRSTYYNTVMDLSHQVVAMANGASAFSNSYTYDADGNILTLNRRNGDNLIVDNLIYTYPDATLNNKLNSVSETAGGAAVGGGIPPNQQAVNYYYDKIGNLAKDVQGGLDSIYWNAYGNVRDIKMNDDNKHLFYSYDAMGNRVRKDFVQMSGGNGIRTSDVYVRDATGNILAVYKGKSRITGGNTIEWANNDVITHHDGTWVTPSGYGILPFLVQQYGNSGQFTAPLLDIAQVQSPSWSTNQSNSFSLQQYFELSDGMYSQVVNSNVDGYFGSLVNSEIVNNTGILSSNLASRIIRQRNFSPILAELVKRNGTESSTVTQARVTKVLTKMQTVAPNTFSEVLKDFAIKPSKPADDVNALATKIVVQRQDQQFVASFVRVNGIDGDFYNNELTQFSSGTLKDSAVVNSDWVKNHSTTSSNVASIVRTTPERESSAAFFDHWLHGADPNWLTNNTTMTDRLNVVMQADQTTFMGSYLDNFGMAPINQTLANLVSVSAYVQSIWEGVLHGTLNPNYTPPDVNTPGPDNLGADTLYLAEHHLYGSSRLGIKTYLSNQYRVVYQGPTTPGGQGTILDNTLNEQVPWYSFGMADWIKKDKAETYSGSTYNATSDAVSETRSLGSKQYELTDHLGNILSTVVDRNTGYGDSLSLITGLHYYKGYYANLASVTDYFPGGMEMPGRIKQSALSMGYRFGNQEQEGDNEIYGEGNVSIYKYRFEDTRLNRFFSVDPLTNKFPWNSSYAFSENRLTDGVDLEGLEFVKKPNPEAKTLIVVSSNASSSMFSRYDFKRFYESALENDNVDVLRVSGILDFKKYLGAVKDGQYSNVFIADHGYTRDAGQVIGGTIYTRKMITNDQSYQNNIQLLGEKIKPQGNLILGGCFVADPSIGGNEYLSMFAKLTQRKVYGNQGEGILDNYTLGKLPYGIRPKKSGAWYNEKGRANAGKFSLAYPNGYVDDKYGGLGLTLDGSPRKTNYFRIYSSEKQN